VVASVRIQRQWRFFGSLCEDTEKWRFCGSLYEDTETMEIFW